MKKEEADNVLKELINAGSQITGSVSGAILGLSIGGVPGAIMGGSLGPTITNVMEVIGQEIRKRTLGPREEVRIGAVLTYAIKKINENIKEGKEIRNDGFFERNEDERIDADEILEGILISAQRSYQEKKLKFLGNLYTSIAFDSSCDAEWGNYYIRITENLSFRQLCLLQIYRHKPKYDLNREVTLDQSYVIIRMDTISELYDLRDLGLLRIKTPMVGIENSVRQLPPEYIDITKFGINFCEMLGLEEVELNDIRKVGMHFNITIPDY